MEVFIFYFFALLTIFAGLGVLLHPNPVLCALHLVVSMVGVAGLFFILQAHFIAGVQLAVYAGAVMVLFLIVVMLFNLKEEKDSDFSPGQIANGFKVLFSGLFMGMGAFHVIFKYLGTSGTLATQKAVTGFEVTNIAKILYTDYVFVFEALGVLLLVVPVGTVALSRIRGGTHNA